MFDRGLCLPASPQVGIFDWVEFGNRNWAPVKYAALSLREFHGVKMIRMKNSVNLKEDEILERNKNLNRGFRKLPQ